MRTTLTLDDDVVALLKRVQSDSSMGFKELVNHALRIGLKAPGKSRPKRPRYRQPSTDSGPCLIGSIADIEHVLDETEGPMRR